MSECHRSILLKFNREYLKIQPYPMSVYLNVHYGEYLEWEAERKNAPQEVLDLADSWNKPPNLSREKHPEQWQARREDFIERANRGESYDRIGEIWGISATRVFQIINQAESLSETNANQIMAKIDTSSIIETKKDILSIVKTVGLSESTQKAIAKALGIE